MWTGELLITRKGSLEQCDCLDKVMERNERRETRREDRDSLTALEENQRQYLVSAFRPLADVVMPMPKDEGSDHM